MSALLTAWLIVGSAQAQDQPPPEAVAWVAKLETAYAHYKSITPDWEASASLGPLCPRPPFPVGAAVQAQLGPEQKALLAKDHAALGAACEAHKPTSWRIRLELLPTDQRVFSPLAIRVGRVESGKKGDAVLEQLLAHGASGSKAYQALIGSGPYIVEINAPCGASGLWAYDLDDAVRAVEAVNPTAKISRVAVSPCGRLAFTWQTRDDIQTDARMPREYWGLDFPEVRDRTLGRKTVDPFAVE